MSSSSASTASSVTTTTTVTTVTTVTVTVEECFDHFNEFLTREKAGVKETFYKEEATLKEKAVIGETMVNELIQKGCGKEVAKDLAILTLYDIVILIDDSSSMRVEETEIEKEENGKLVKVKLDVPLRIDTLQKTLEQITEIYDLTKGNGILSVRFLNNRQGKRNVTNEKAKTLLQNHAFTGVTRIGTELQRKILDKFVFKKPGPKGETPEPMKKPLLVMVITDGAVEGEKKGLLETVIRKCVMDLKEHPTLKKDAVAFHFSRVGNDEGAKKQLEDLDNHREVGDYVDCLPVTARLEDITKEEYKWAVLPKLLVGAIVEDWNDQDSFVEHTLEDPVSTEQDEVESDVE